MNSLQNKYNKIVRLKLFKHFGFKSIMQVPKIQKIVLNMTAGSEVANSKAIEEVKNDLSLITGQKPAQVVAKKSLASWKIRQGMPMGFKVTLRREYMWNFLSKLIDIVIPRIRDFRGINNKSFDGHGNFALGVKEHIIFPEINFDKVQKIRGLDVIIVTSASKDEEGRELLKLIGLPFKAGK